MRGGYFVFLLAWFWVLFFTSVSDIFFFLSGIVTLEIRSLEKAEDDRPDPGGTNLPGQFLSSFYFLKCHSWTLQNLIVAWMWAPTITSGVALPQMPVLSLRRLSVPLESPHQAIRCHNSQTFLPVGKTSKDSGPDHLVLGSELWIDCICEMGLIQSWGQWSRQYSQLSWGQACNPLAFPCTCGKNHTLIHTLSYIHTHLPTCEKMSSVQWSWENTGVGTFSVRDKEEKWERLEGCQTHGINRFNMNLLYSCNTVVLTRQSHICHIFLSLPPQRHTLLLLLKLSSMHLSAPHPSMTNFFLPPWEIFSDNPV